MNTLLRTLIAASLAAGVAAHASTITFETASSGSGPQIDAASYRRVVNEALAAPGAQAARVAVFDGLSNQSVFGGSNMDIAYRATIRFDIGAADAGPWGLRAGVDFGNGGAVFLDGVALAHKTNDMWWAGAYDDGSQSFQFASLPLDAGRHRLRLFGLEQCCDGGQQVQFSIGGGPYRSFAADDGLTVSIPEPGVWALLLAGLAAIGFVSRRRVAPVRRAR